MTLFNAYLREEATFFSPLPDLAQTNSGSSDVNEAEVEYLSPEWRPKEAHPDTNLVDALIQILDDCLGECPLPPHLSKYFQEMYEDDSQGCDKNGTKADARDMVFAGPLKASTRIMREFGHHVKFRREGSTCTHGISSKVDYILSASETKKVLVDIKAPNILEATASTYINPGRGFRINLDSSSVSETQKVINKVSLCMASHRSRWLVLTCHDKWIFFRLHEGIAKPYITYSKVECLSNNTRPFRALLGMLLASERDLEVESCADVKNELETDEDVEQQLDLLKSSLPPEYPNGLHEELYPSQLLKSRTMRSSDVWIRWATEVAPSSRLLSFHATEGTEQCLTLGNEPIRLCLQRQVGAGSTGIVYEARLDTDGSESHGNKIYAIKWVVKGKTEREKNRLQRLRTEFEIYRIVEQARQKDMNISVAPRCYGLFESQRSAALIIDYEGDSLSDKDWLALTRAERSAIFGGILELHKIGINHYDVAPRNILRNADGSFKIIDFTSSALHRCPGLRAMDENNPNDGQECGELKAMWRMLMKRGSRAVDKKFKNANTKSIS